VGQQALKRRAIGVAQGDMLFIHVQSIPDIRENGDKLSLQSAHISSEVSS
jgi:hypothetical protein